MDTRGALCRGAVADLLPQGFGRRAQRCPDLFGRTTRQPGVANTDTDGYHETITQASLRAARSFLLQNPGRSLFATCNALMAIAAEQIRLAAGLLEPRAVVFSRSPAQLGGA